MNAGAPRVAVIMGSKSDWPVMRRCVETLETLGIACESRVISAHRTPDRLLAFCAEAEGRGLRVLIAGAGMAAALPGMMAALTKLPVLGVPLESSSLQGFDALLSMVQMPGGVPVATFAVGEAGAVNAAAFAAAILALGDEAVAKALGDWRRAQGERVPETPEDGS